MARQSPWALHRLAIAAIVLVLGAVTLLFLRGPEGWQRRYYPLRYQQAIEDSAIRHKVSPYLIAAVIEAESDWDPSAESKVGASGLMQLMPSTAKQFARWKRVDAKKFPPDNLDDPTVSIEYGAAYLRYLVERYHEVEAALAAYNAGLGHADAWVAQGGDIRDHIDFPETKHFVLKVSRSRDRYEALYPAAFEAWRETQ